MNTKLAVAFLIGLAAIFQANARLAVTEVMPSASGNFPDWWELTNLGTNDVDLSGYSWRDNSAPGFLGATNLQFNGVIIHTNESVIFCETKGTAGGTTGVLTAEDFRTWWGLGTNVQVIIIGINPGLSSTGDSIRLWSTNWAALDVNTNGLDLNNAPEYLVDRVDTSATTQGRSLIYNPANGKFDFSSTDGVNGAFTAAYGGDIGSPGTVADVPAPLNIAQQPADQLVNLGATTTFSVQAYGLPKPRFQWLFNGSPINTNWVKEVFTVTNNYAMSTITITNVQLTNGGTFRAVVTNGFQAALISSNAVLSVNTDPLAPFFTLKPVESLTAYPGQVITFRSDAFGSPTPAFYWQFNSNAIAGETDPIYSFYVADTNQSGIYTVTATNVAGATNTSIYLTVTPKPNLRITEACVNQATNSANSTAGHNDWWELSNFGDFAVNLKGYRFDDNSFLLSAACTITNDVTIAPGETIIFAEKMTPDAFRAWWGAENLRPGLQIIRYEGGALSFSSTSGDALTLWNPAATSEGDFIDSVSLAVNQPTPEVRTFGFDPYTRIFWGTVPNGLSVAGENGAFAAAFNSVYPDIGSPGTVINVPQFGSITKTQAGTELNWFTQPDWTNFIQYKNDLSDPVWLNLTNVFSTSTNGAYLDPATVSNRFYRVNLKP